MGNTQSLPVQPLQGPISSLSYISISKSAIWTANTVGVNGSAGLYKTAPAFFIHQAVYTTPLDYLNIILQQSIVLQDKLCWEKENSGSLSLQPK